MFAKSIESMERWLARVSMAAVFIIMIFVSADVIARYVFNSPITVQYHLTQDYLMVAMVALSLSWAEGQGAFIRLTPFQRWMNLPARRGLYALNSVIAALLFLLMTWYAGVRTWEDWVAQRVSFGVIDWPVWLSQIWVPIGTLALALRLLLNAVEYALGLKVPPSAHSPEDEALLDHTEGGK